MQRNWILAGCVTSLIDSRAAAMNRCSLTACETTHEWLQQLYSDGKAADGTQWQTWYKHTTGLEWVKWLVSVQPVECRLVHDAQLPHRHNCFTALFPRPPGWAGARREPLDFMVQGKINRGRHTDHPAGRHSIRPKQCPPPPSPCIFTGRMPSLPPNQQCQSTKGN